MGSKPGDSWVEQNPLRFGLMPKPTPPISKDNPWGARKRYMYMYSMHTHVFIHGPWNSPFICLMFICNIAMTEGSSGVFMNVRKIFGISKDKRDNIRQTYMCTHIHISVVAIWALTLLLDPPSIPLSPPFWDMYVCLCLSFVHSRFCLFLRCGPLHFFALMYVRLLLYLR